MSDQEPLPKMVDDVSGGTDPEAGGFDRGELAIVLSYYDIGLIEDIRVLKRGSRKAPKLIIKSRTGEYLLKRRAPGRDDPYRVAFTQSMQVHLTSRGYPVPRLIGTRFDNNSMLQLHGTIYELFQYVEGSRYDHSPMAAMQSGAALGLLHREIAEFESPYEAPIGGYHDAREIDDRFAAAPEAAAGRDGRERLSDLQREVQAMQHMYHRAAKVVNEAGFRRWDRKLTHGDWHPGNLLYRDVDDDDDRGTGDQAPPGRRVVAVLDFDSARLEPFVADLANGILQFSMRMGPIERPETWPVGLDEGLIRAFWQGYHQRADDLPDKNQRRVIPHLILEALILECIVPIAATGSFGTVPGGPFLRMIGRTAEWIEQRTEPMAAVFTDR